jgi:acetylornithine deacetylase/succinyl-diaminopimelate desuccinylase-like protein
VSPVEDWERRLWSFLPFTEQSWTLVPAKAMAKISFRLVPNQDPAEVKTAITDF